MRYRALAIILICLLITIRTNLMSSDIPNSDGKKIRRLEISFLLGGYIGGPCRDIEEAAIGAGFAGYSEIWRQSYPNSYMDELSYMLSLHYKINPLISYELILSRTNLGMTDGLHADGPFLRIDNFAQTIASIAIVRWNSFRLGIGPAFYILGSQEKKDERNSSYKFGLIIDLSWVSSQNSRIFIDIKTQYRIIGKSEIGPYEATRLDMLAMFPAARVNYNHLFIGLGLGIRF